MRHYEIMFLVHPDQSEQVAVMIERYTKIIAEQQGVVHRQEDLGRRQLAYAIDNVHKAHYVLLNIECDQKTLNEIESGFSFNDAIIRYLIERKKQPETAASLLLQKKEDKQVASV